MPKLLVRFLEEMKIPFGTITCGSGAEYTTPYLLLGYA